MSVKCAVRDDGDSPVVVLAGRLELTDVGPIRLRLLKCLAAQPAAVLVDLAEMTVGEPLALSVFLAVSREAARWPGIPILLCAPDQRTRAALTGGAYRRLPLFLSIEAANRHATAYRRSLPTLIDELLPIAGAARQARNVATEACLRWDLPDLVGPASLIASEFMSNVVDHASTMATLRLTLGTRYLTITVRDGSPAEPVAALNVGPKAKRGRGLMLVDAIAHSWGWVPAEGGKVVWASLAL